MSQTLTSLLVHLVFSTKNREPLITIDVEPQLFAYMGGILRNYQSRLLDAGGDRDHVHLLVSQSKNIALSNLLKEVKGDSSLWIKSQGRAFRNFHWQDGYGAFSFGRADLPALQRYVSTQKEHHRKWTYKEELIWMLEENGVEYDERYLWN
jgi:putative transposase